MRSPAESFARALAERLDAVVPRPVNVRADGSGVAVYVGDEWWGTSLVGEVLVEPEVGDGGEPWPLAERIETAARAVLSSVQDTVAVARAADRRHGAPGRARPRGAGAPLVWPGRAGRRSLLRAALARRVHTSGYL